MEPFDEIMDYFLTGAGTSAGISDFGRCGGPDPERVDVRLHQLAQGVVDQLVTPYAAQARECLGHDMDVEMALAILRALMPDM
jgi:hypothetical protein